MIKSISYVSILLLSLLFACDDDSVSGLRTPCDELESTSLDWLQKIIEEESTSSTFFVQFSWFKSFTYKGQPLIIAGSCCPHCLWVPVFYTCHGIQLTLSEKEYSDIYDSWQKGTVIWQGSACNL